LPSILCAQHAQFMPAKGEGQQKRSLRGLKCRRRQNRAFAGTGRM
jgi:hypothetical protein